MTYSIEIERAAQKFINRQPAPQKLRLYKAIAKLPEGDVKPLSGSSRYRLRVGDYRVIYERYDDVLRICVVAVGNRGDVYK